MKKTATVRMDVELYVRAQNLAWKHRKSLNEFNVEAIQCMCEILEHAERSDTGQNTLVTPRSEGTQDEYKHTTEEG